MPLNALSRLLCGRPGALGGAHPLELSKRHYKRTLEAALWETSRAWGAHLLEPLNTTKRTLRAALWEAARAWGRAPSIWNPLNATKRTLQAALWEAARVLDFLYRHP